MKYCLKSYLVLYESKEYIYIGSPSSTKHLKCKKNKENTDLIKRIVHGSISYDVVKSKSIYYSLFRKKMLTEKKQIDSFEKRRNNYFDFFDIDHHEKILDKRILILGCGGGGASIAYLLAQFGFTNIAVVDSDIVKMTDIRKTMVYHIDHINKKKVNALASIAKTNFGINIVPIDKMPTNKSDLTEIFNNYLPEFVIKACDPEPKFRDNLNFVCFSKKIPFTQLSYSYKNLYVGPTYIPGVTSCDKGYEQLLKKLYGNDMLFNSTKRIYNEKTTHPSISFNINLVSNLLLKEIVFHFLNKQEFLATTGNLLCFDPLTMKGYTYEIKCDIDCPICKN